ncbi:Uncharacterized conserved protein, DUF1697 family [Paenibacillus sophorae]|uniref:DUF1697 domain-containing protein n=1 Tax=Paenibacillus sophorae TaxID=1333845 RepID=A0A1H8SDS7_9BACL|nr:DUF1697 domain-containing protein [Paenibacillus sophorae]QWU16774.1 DUF1697 domain-containing protein [Paenibacillus sophorae]SEO76343.1 Uncharacterized conserved protein, DUF1697 family [Paenibacillus sophorae]
MEKYIALIRGINVGGNKIVKMQDLKTMLQSLGFQNVKTYIQSGNVVFDGRDTGDEALGEAIEQGIRETFGFEASVVIRTAKELEAAIANNPFELTEAEEFKRLYVSFLAGELTDEALERLRPYEDGEDKLRVVGKEMYILYKTKVAIHRCSRSPWKK